MVPQVEVTFDIDVNGILSVSAKDKAFEIQSVKIEASTSLNKEEIERLNRKRPHAVEDEKRRAVIEVKNQAESMIYVAEKDLVMRRKSPN